MNAGAVISDDQVYRYVLWRVLTPLPGEKLAGTILWVCLNPSTADASRDDATLRKVCGFSRRWGFKQPRIVNLYALRSREPKALWKHLDPVGPENNNHICAEVGKADAIVFAWGGNAKADRAKLVEGLVSLSAQDGSPIWHLGLTESGQPKHPLMLGYDTVRKEID